MNHRVHLLTACLAVGLAGLAAAQPVEPLVVRCTWWPPETGSIPVHYNLNILDPRPEAAFDTTYVVPHLGGEQGLQQEFIFEDGDYWVHYQARVQAVDAQGRAGPWSAWSEIVVYEIPAPEP